jgi:oligoendopeptidase F
MSIFAGPSWDLSNQFDDLNDPKLAQVQVKAKSLSDSIKTHGQPFEAWLKAPVAEQQALSTSLIDLVPPLFKIRDEAKTLLADAATYCHCRLSVDATLAEAKRLLSLCDVLDSELSIALKPLNLWLMLADEATIASLLAIPAMKSEAFAISRLRTLKDQTLSLEQESMLENLAIHGPVAFGRLYDDLTGTMTCQVTKDGEEKAIGLAEAANWLMSSDEAIRRNTYEAITTTFRNHEESFAAIINSLTGWRHSVLELRSHRTPQHYLSTALYNSNISRKTLDAMMHALESNRDIGQKAAKLQARLLGKKALDPWDLAAPLPKKTGHKTLEMTFDQGIETVCKAFGSVSPDMESFVKMMAQRRWIDGSNGPNKRPGAYCTEFLAAREPRVYMTYSGSMSNVGTLAHELGHALHAWVMRDMALSELSYPMTLAETASIFGEFLLSDHLMKKMGDRPHDLLATLWENAGDAVSYLINIPARFSMECAFNDHRKKGPLTPDDLRRLTHDAWTHWYGDSLSTPNTMFWASKLHFSIASLSFYNFPYSFGYLFSLSVFARREQFGKNFFQTYTNLLRDTGRMSAEELARKHLGANISDPDFWQNALDIVKGRVDQFAAVSAQLSS